MLNIAVIILAYLIGSLSSAIIVCKLWRLPDPRKQGSKNPGATNVLRIGGKVPAAITMLGDGLKGFLPTLIISQLDFPAWVVGSVMLAAMLGHIWPIFFGFKGGKGVATAMGSYLGLSWILGTILITIWATVILLTRLSSLGALVATFLTPFIAWTILHNPVLVGFMALMSLILLYRHKANIIRLLTGKEAKV